MEGHGGAKPQQLKGPLALEPEIRPLQAQDFQLPDVVQAEQAGHQLGDEGGRRRPADAPLEHHDKENVQHDIGEGGHHHGLQRRFSVPQGAQDAGQQVVGHDDGDAQEHDPQIEQGSGQDVRRGPQQGQHREGGPLARPHQQQGKQGGQHGGFADDVPEPVMLPRAELPGHEDAEALGEPLDNTQHHPVQPVRRPQRRQRGHAQIFPHHHGVHHGVELLKHIAHHEGQREGED